MLQQAYQQGNVMIGPMGLVISNYVKQGDSMTLVMNKAQKALVSLSITTYLSDPSDAVKVNVQFSRLPGAPNHAATETIDGVSKKLTIAVQNTNYQHMSGSSPMLSPDRKEFRIACPRHRHMWLRTSVSVFGHPHCCIEVFMA
jgi:hypothetical protein